MRTVRNTVDTGRTVVCTIHQPSIDIFEAFDELLLLKRGGRIIYFGELGAPRYMGFGWTPVDHQAGLGMGPALLCGVPSSSVLARPASCAQGTTRRLWSTTSRCANLNPHLPLIHCSAESLSSRIALWLIRISACENIIMSRAGIRGHRADQGGHQSGDMDAGADRRKRGAQTWQGFCRAVRAVRFT